MERVPQIKRSYPHQSGSKRQANVSEAVLRTKVVETLDSACMSQNTSQEPRPSSRNKAQDKTLHDCNRDEPRKEIQQVTLASEKNSQRPIATEAGECCLAKHRPEQGGPPAETPPHSQRHPGILGYESSPFRQTAQGKQDRKRRESSLLTNLESDTATPTWRTPTSSPTRGPPST